MIEQKAVRVDGELVADIEKELIIAENGVLLQKGKRGFMRVIKK